MSMATSPAARVLAVSPAALAMSLALALPAAARGFVSFGFGVPLVGPAYPPPVYYGPPAYYYPPPPYMASPYAAPPYTAPYAAPPVAYAPPAIDQRDCREYRTTTTIGGVSQPVYGTACRQPDGTWRIIR